MSDYEPSLCEECGQPIGFDTYGVCERCVAKMYDPCEDNDE